MKRRCVLILLAVFLLGAAPDDREKLQGTWKVVGVEHAGKKAPAEQYADLYVVIRGNELTGKEDDQVRERFTFALDPAKKTIDTTAVEGPAKGETSLGIYELDGDALKLCVSEKGKERPTQLATKVGSDWVLLVLQRVKK